MADATFRVTEDHIKLAQALAWTWSDMEAGAPTVDPKRPYGYSDVPGSVADVLGWDTDEEDGLSDEQEDRAWEMHEQMLTVVQIGVGLLQPRVYHKSGDGWGAR